jgi:hypothetical protein
VFRDGVLYVVQVNAKTFSFDNKLLEFVPEKVGSLGFGGGGALGDNSRGTRTDFEKSRLNEGGDHFVRCVGIDFEFATEGADRGKIVAGAKLAGDDGSRGGVHNLFVKGRAGSEADVEGDQRAYYYR